MPSSSSKFKLSQLPTPKSHLLQTPGSLQQAAAASRPARPYQWSSTASSAPPSSASVSSISARTPGLLACGLLTTPRRRPPPALIQSALMWSPIPNPGGKANIAIGAMGDSLKKFVQDRAKEIARAQRKPEYDQHDCFLAVKNVMPDIDDSLAECIDLDRKQMKEVLKFHVFPAPAPVPLQPPPMIPPMLQAQPQPRGVIPVQVVSPTDSRDPSLHISDYEIGGIEIVGEEVTGGGAEGSGGGAEPEDGAAKRQRID